ncbi:hypothetical protein [Aquisalinus flavus]|uniref:Uncharacterized protein n=1 Tax=Aquisalinus flavus TaxID=1526572 RepID=A0A8J2V5B7_9PROT|nr:hypothetical protein [Aquisalinus flavus]MBD0426178.1 hypothetical protein [Aquisalinus flavus]UNE48247.1 hypothetical protein FF099_09370 [Aquisalinus flavus]GGD09960.1 hypothetical protein GCM10011342_18600 [Aquisalinus flavus]
MTDANKHNTSPAPQPQPQPSDGQPQGEEVPVDNLLGLKLLVVSMGVLLVVAAITFVILLVVKSNEPEETVPAPVTTIGQTGENVPAVQLSLEPGEEIVDMVLDGRNLALHLKTADGERILIIDPYTSDHRAVIDIARD